MKSPASSEQHLGGLCDPRLAPVREAFQECFRNLGETGAALAVYVGGELLCDLWGGTAGGGRDWEENTLVMPYSVSKPFAALCCLVLADRGRLDPNAPVADVWPEFAVEGKGKCTIRELLEHRAGVPFAPEGCGLEDLLAGEALADQVAALPPLWEPGAVLAEHALLYGHLCCALVRRVAGTSLGNFFRSEVAEPLGVSLYFGLPADKLGECAQLSPWPDETIQELRGLTPLAEKGLFEPDVLCKHDVVNSAEWRQAEIPAVNLHATARSVAKVYALLAAGGELEGIRLLKTETAALLQRPSDVQVDKVFGFESSWALGFQHRGWTDEATGETMGSRFGLGGIGGSSAWGNAQGGIGFAYLTREMGGWQRAEHVELALLRALLSLGKD